MTDDIKWKEGMKVKIKAYCSGCKKGEIYILSSDYGFLIAQCEPPESRGCSCVDNWILIPDVITDWERSSNEGAITDWQKEMEEKR